MDTSLQAQAERWARYPMEAEIMGFTTIDDVVLEIRNADPGFDELTDEELREIVRDCRVNPYEQITRDEVNWMVAAAYIACDVDEESAEELADVSRSTECAYCGHEAEQIVPDIRDDEEWKRLSQQHAGDCEWIQTRAHRVGLET